jgi:hypothetical protein
MDKIKETIKGGNRRFLLELGNIRLSHFSRKNKPLIGGIFSDLWAFCL